MRFYNSHLWSVLILSLFLSEIVLGAPRFNSKPSQRKILREAGELYAATVAFEAALHSATHDEQRTDIEHEVLVTQRLGDFAPRRSRDLTRAERWFTEHGTVVLAATGPGRPPTTTELVHAFVSLAHDRGWEFGQVVAPSDDAISRTQSLPRPLCTILRPCAAATS